MKHRTRGFWISEFEISFAEIGKVFTKNDYTKRQGVAVGFSYFQAGKFCKTLTEIAKHNKVFSKGYQYRLPTEAQWRQAVNIVGKKLGISKKNIDTVEWCSDVFSKEMATGKDPEKKGFDDLQSVRVVVRGSGKTDADSRGSAEPWIRSESATFRVVLVKE
jgi:formylglycine-generating enzyme required for sulfatase activity